MILSCIDDLLDERSNFENRVSLRFVDNDFVMYFVVLSFNQFSIVST